MRVSGLSDLARLVDELEQERNTLSQLNNHLFVENVRLKRKCNRLARIVKRWKLVRYEDGGDGRCKGDGAQGR